MHSASPQVAFGDWMLTCQHLHHSPVSGGAEKRHRRPINNQHCNENSLMFVRLPSLERNVASMRRCDLLSGSSDAFIVQAAIVWFHLKKKNTDFYFEN